MTWWEDSGFKLMRGRLGSPYSGGRWKYAGKYKAAKEWIVRSGCETGKTCKVHRETLKIPEGDRCASRREGGANAFTNVWARGANIKASFISVLEYANHVMLSEAWQLSSFKKTLGSIPSRNVELKVVLSWSSGGHGQVSDRHSLDVPV